jgi:hypothetical protein
MGDAIGRRPEGGGGSIIHNKYHGYSINLVTYYYNHYFYFTTDGVNRKIESFRNKSYRIPQPHNDIRFQQPEPPPGNEVRSRGVAPFCHRTKKNRSCIVDQVAPSMGPLYRMVWYVVLSSGYGYTLCTQSRRLHVQLCDVISSLWKKINKFLCCVSESKKPSQSQKSSDGLTEPQLCDWLAPWCCPMPSPSGDKS